MQDLIIDWTRINNDVNGNPRYVCHFLSVPFGKASIARIESALASHNALNHPKEYKFRLDFEYAEALRLAKTIGGKKYHNKRYGGGIVFQSYNLAETEKSILNLLNY